MFGLHRFKLHRHLVDGTVKSVWFQQVFVYSGFSRWDCKVCLVSAGFRFTQGSVDGTKICLVSAGFRFTQGSVDGTVKSVWFQQVFGLLRVW